jgi:nucleoside-diphosphate-sugar epimerase
LPAKKLAGYVPYRFGTTLIALRLSHVHLSDPARDASHSEFPAVWVEPERRRPNLWGYIDADDAARALELALTVDVTGSHAVTIAAADTLMPTPTADLVAGVYPASRVNGPRQVPGACTEWMTLAACWAGSLKSAVVTGLRRRCST